MKVLYIEDNLQNMRLVRKMLSFGGYEMIEAMDGISGLQVAEREHPDLILLNMNLPDIDGIEATSRIRSTSSLKDVPVVALTANTVYGEGERFLAAGCNGYLAKPVTKNELLNTVSKLLNKTA